MAITTIADALAKCLPQPTEFVRQYSGAPAGHIWKDSWAETLGFGSAGNIAGASSGGLCTKDTAPDYFRYDNPVGGNKKYLCKVSGYCSNVQGPILTGAVGSWYIADRLMQCGSLSHTSTSVQTLNTITLPARDANGTSNGEGVWLGLAIWLNTTSATATVTVSYTNSAGTAGRSGIINTADQTVSRGNISMMQMDAGDTGVRSVQTIQLSATMGPAGTIGLVFFRPLLFCSAGHGRAYRSFLGPLDIGFPEFPDDCCPMVGGNGTAIPYLAAEFTFAEG